MVILILIYLCYRRNKKITISLNKPSHVQARKSEPESESEEFEDFKSKEKSKNSAEYINVFDINATKNEDIPFKRTGTLPIFVKNY